MPLVVVLDACVLYPLPLRDTLLRVARQNLYTARWRQRILDEVTRNLIDDRRATTRQAANKAFLCDMYERSAARVRDALDRQAADLSRPPCARRLS